MRRRTDRSPCWHCWLIAVALAGFWLFVAVALTQVMRPISKALSAVLP